MAWPVAMGFIVNGGLYGGMLSRYAEIAADAHAGAAAFGVALTAGALGGLTGSVVAPIIMRVSTEKTAVLVGGLAYALLSVALPLAPSPVLLGAAFFVVGVFDGGHDVSMNALTVRYQQRLRIPMMGRMHALWSLALAAGAALGAAAAAVGVAPLVHLGVMAGLLGGAQLVAGRAASVTTSGDDSRSAGGEQSTGRSEPSSASGARGLLAVIVLAAIAASYIEGPGQDWSALLLTDTFHADAGIAAAAPFAFSIGLLIARLLLDPLRTRLSAAQIATAATTFVIGGALGGLLAALLSAPPIAALASLALIGFGAGPIYPMLFDTADTLGSRYRITAATTAGIISTCSRIGAITAPVLVGALAHTTGLSVVLVVVATAGTLAVITLPRALRP
ncbi:MFS transporter [Brevibacterium picturae]|uniref:MFS transporter n=1 Tax=Brevibacterium picturae TaxID=260553 RepID=A0ABN2C5Y3_9MICO